MPSTIYRNVWISSADGLAGNTVLNDVVVNFGVVSNLPSNAKVYCRPLFFTFTGPVSADIPAMFLNTYLTSNVYSSTTETMRTSSTLIGLLDIGATNKFEFTGLSTDIWIPCELHNAQQRFWLTDKPTPNGSIINNVDLLNGFPNNEWLVNLIFKIELPDHN